MKIAVIGTGYVGLVSGACFAEFGIQTVCVDKLEGKIEQLSRGEIPIYEPGLEQVVKRNFNAGRLRFDTDLEKAVDEADVIFICVGTPMGHDRRADLSAIFEVAKRVAQAIKKPGKVVVTKSTVPVGTAKKIKQVITENLGAPVEFHIASNPEFLREGSAVEDFLRPSRVVIGAENETAAAIVKSLYRPLYLIETPIVVTDLETSELIKYAANGFLAMKISFINEVAALCDQVGADVKMVAKGIGLDNRIGGKFLHPGPGYGGSCFPKDTEALLKTAEDAGMDFALIRAAIAVNDAVVPRLMQEIEAGLGGLRDKKIGLLGLSFKPETDDVRDSPAMKVLAQLLDRRAQVQAFDPVAMAAAAREFPQVTYCPNAYAAAEGVDALVIATEWNQFRQLDLPRLKAAMQGRRIYDLRNIYEPETMATSGFQYSCIGRPALKKTT